MEPISEEQVKEAFNSDNIQVFTDSKKLETYLLAQKWKNANLLLMSSGNFDGIDFKELAEKVLN
ncbi:hypothetical protein D3C86_2042470 [compost metagenome]